MIARNRKNRRIYLCTFAAQSGHIMLLTIGNNVYTVDMETIEKAKEAHNQLLVRGYYDFSNFEYYASLSKGRRMKLIEIWEKLGKQPLRITRDAEAIVFVNEVPYTISKIRYEHGRFIGFEANQKE